MVLTIHLTVCFACFLTFLTCFFASLIVVASMGSRYVYKDMLDNIVSLIVCVSMIHQNQLQQMANGVMFATICLPINFTRQLWLLCHFNVNILSSNFPKLRLSAAASTFPVASAKWGKNRHRSCSNNSCICICIM
jgi:hypothetical protein